MSTCTKWVDTVVITCKNWTSKLDHECTTWADEGSKKCSDWADEGSKQCSDWADEGSKQCSAWEKCHWYTPWNCIAGFFCKAYYWVAKWVCKAYYWVAKWVCKAYYWVAKWVCKAFAWVIKFFCTAWGWAAKLACVAWDTVRCAIVNLQRAISGIFGGHRKDRRRIKHVFVLMLENRSFDHMLAFSGISGVDLAGNPKTINAANPATDKNDIAGGGPPVAVSAPAAYTLSGVDKDPGHEFANTVTALCGDGVAYTAGQPYPAIDNSGFMANYRDTGSSDPGRIMQCFGRDQVPVMVKLAEEFAVCDNWFSSLPGPTWPNRFFAMAATSGGLDDSPTGFEVVSATTVDGYRFANGNIFDLLDNACLPWRIFHDDEFPVAFALSGMNLNRLQGRLRDFDDFDSEVNAAGFSDSFVFIEPRYGSHKFDVTGPGDYTCGNSMHPYDDITRGEKLIKRVYELIRNSPHWNDSLLIVTFDEHGGFYDHVEPPAATPPGDLFTPGYVKNHFTFDRYGVRVPALVISPYTQKSLIDSTVFDHTSMLATVERLFGMGSLTNRDAGANDVLPLLNLSTPRTDAPATLPSPAVNRENPLSCEDDDETESELRVRLLDLYAARARGVFKDRRVESFEVERSQIGFTQVALLRAIDDATYAERQRWIDDYNDIKNGVDAAIFMAEARLKVRHAINVKTGPRLDRPEPVVKREETPPPPTRRPPDAPRQ